MTVGEKIRILRLHNNWTQKHLANLVGVSEITIRKYENQNSGIRAKHLERLADIFGVDISVLTANSIQNDNDIMQLLFLLRDEFRLRVAHIDDVPSQAKGAVLYFDDFSRCSLLRTWLAKQEELKSSNSSGEDLIAWELLFPKSHADDCKARLDMHRKRGKITERQS